MNEFGHRGAIFFDLDGTLVDTAPDLGFALNTLRARKGLAPLALARIRPAVAGGTVALLKLGLDFTPEDIGFASTRDEFLNFYRKHLCEDSRLFPGMEAVLATIEQLGLPWGVVTNKPAWLTQPLLEYLDLAKRSACIVSGDTTARRKPHPDSLLHACKETHSTPAHSIYIGDALCDIQAGKAAGLTTLTALYGYIPDRVSAVSWGADGVLEAPADVLPWIEKCAGRRIA